jgi:hypothetical protein
LDIHNGGIDENNCTFVPYTARMNFSGHLQNEVFQVISRVAREEEMPAYVIGGFVRDLIISGKTNPGKDIDIVVVGSGKEGAGR